MASNTVYLITGANKGIGRALVTLLLARPNTTVVAAVRRPNDPTSASLPSLPAAAGSRLILLKLAADADYASLMDRLAAAAPGGGVARLDVVVANAGASSGYRAVLDTSPEDARFDFEVNALGPLKLFRACWPLLGQGDGKVDNKNSEGGGDNRKRFVVVTSSVASIAGLESESMPSAAYGMSKVALNWLSKKISIEFQDRGLAVGILHPGWVKTLMGQGIADAVGAKEPPMEVEDSARGCLEQIDSLTMEKSGKFLMYDGAELPW